MSSKSTPPITLKILEMAERMKNQESVKIDF